MQKRKEFHPLVLVSGCASGKLVAFDGNRIAMSNEKNLGEEAVLWSSSLSVRNKVEAKRRRKWWEYRNHPSCFCITDGGLKVLMSQYQVLGVASFRLNAKNIDKNGVARTDDADNLRKTRRKRDSSIGRSEISSVTTASGWDKGNRESLVFERIAATHRDLMAPEGVCEVGGNIYIASSFRGYIYHYNTKGGTRQPAPRRNSVAKASNSVNDSTLALMQDTPNVCDRTAVKLRKGEASSGELQSFSPTSIHDVDDIPRGNEKNTGQGCSEAHASIPTDSTGSSAQTQTRKVRKKPVGSSEEIDSMQTDYVSRINLAKILGVHRVEPWNMILEPENLMPPPPLTPRKRRRKNSLAGDENEQDSDESNQGSGDDDDDKDIISSFRARMGLRSSISIDRDAGEYNNAGGDAAPGRCIRRTGDSLSGSRYRGTALLRRRGTLRTNMTSSGSRPSYCAFSKPTRHRYLLVSSRIQRTEDPMSSFGAVLRIALTRTGRLTRKVTHLLCNDKNYGRAGYILVRPSGLAVRGDILLVACAYRSWIVKFRWGLFAGVEIPQGVVDQPWDICFDKNGRLYICSHTSESKMEESRVIVCQDGSKVGEFMSKDLRCAGCVRVVQ